MRFLLFLLMFAAAAEGQTPVLTTSTTAACPPVEVPGMRCVPGGKFGLGTDEPHVCAQDENRHRKTTFGPTFSVTVETFFMDETEVTMAAYAACVAAKKCVADGPLYSDFRRPQQPVTALSWFHARDYCHAQGKRLPTEAEWERAAQDTTPPVCPAVVVMDQTGRSCGVPMKPPHTEKGRVLEVKSTAPNAWGLYEMRGNAEEWVQDWFNPDRAAAGPLGPCPQAETCPRFPLKMVKGGSWYWPADHAQSWHRRPWRPTNKPAHHFGFRCAADLAAAHTLASKTTTPKP